MARAATDMADFKIYRSIVGFVVSKPPLVMFFIFIGCFALAFLSLGYYVQHNALVDEEASEEWNHLYSSVLLLSYCFGNHSKLENLSYSFSRNHHSFVNISLPYTLSVPLEEGKWSRNISTMFATVPYFYLHLKDTHTHHKIRLWINVDEESLTDSCSGHKEKSQNCVLQYESCVTLALPKHLLPSSHPPRACNNTHLPSTNIRHFTIVKPGKSDSTRGLGLCGDSVEITLTRHNSYQTEVFLSWEDRSKVNLRLQIASYILFVVLLSFLLYVIIKGRPMKPSLKKMFAT